MVAQWVSLTPGWAGLDQRPTQGRPLVYLESHLGPDGYRALLAGDFDRTLGRLRALLTPEAIVSWDHEPDGPRIERWRRWSDMDPGLYRDGFCYVASRLGRKLYWRATSNWRRWAPYFPGDDAAGWVGWDQFFREAPLRPFPHAFAPRIAECRRLAPALPVLVGETASSVGLPGRLAHIRTLHDVEGIWGAVWFDVDMRASEGPGTDWRLTPKMREALLAEGTA